MRIQTLGKRRNLMIHLDAYRMTRINDEGLRTQPNAVVPLGLSGLQKGEIAHHINNPLCIMQMLLEQLIAREVDDRALTQLIQLELNVKRIGEYVKTITEVSK
jgi:hypothetical protein